MHNMENFSAESLLIGFNAADKSIVFANERSAKYFNIPLSNLLGKNYFTLQAHLNFSGSLPKEFNFVANKKENSNFYSDIEVEQCSDIIWTKLAIQNNQFYLLIGTDISYVRAISNKNAELQTYLDNILRQIPGYLYWKDKQSVYLGCNANFAKVAGLNAPHEIIGKTDYDLAWGDTEAELFLAGDQEALSGIAKLNFEEPQLQANGKYATVLASKIPLYDQENNIIGVLGIYNDITERKQAEQDLAIAKVKAEAANKAKSEFIENMSHDLKTPLNGILGLSTILLSREDDQEKRELIEGIKESGEKLLFLLNEILELSQLEEGYIAIQKKTFNLKELVENIRKLLLIQAQEKNIQLLVHYQDSVPDNIISDPHRVHRILLNLINNALKFTFKGKVEIEIAKAMNNDCEIIISIKDTGIGMPKDKLNIIFDRFTRLEASHTGRYQGSGLGLGIVKQFLTDLGGKIFVDSELGQGTNFTCYIPINSENILPSTEDDFAMATHLRDSGKIRVLIVEDEKLSQIVMSSLLTELNCSFTLAASAEQALTSLDKQYDIIFMDMGLPDKNGLILAKLIREKHAIDTPIVVITAHFSESLKNKCLEAGIQAIYTKPITKEILQNIINTYLPLSAAKSLP